MDAATNHSMTCHAPIAVDGKLGRAHFAHISIDIEGGIHLQCSQSIANAFQGSLSVRLVDIFLKAIAMSEEVGSPITQTSPHQTTPAAKTASPSPRIIHTTTHTRGLDGKWHTRNSLPASPPSSTVGPAHVEPSPYGDIQSLERTKRNVWSKDNRTWRPEFAISITDRDWLRKYYGKAFQNLQQTNCRALAKAYIKMVEPRKQVCFPYNGRVVVGGAIRQLDPDAAKPPWWPPRVRHREPDHLLKEERIRLLVHILCELPTSLGITTKRLREADQPIRRYIVPEQRVCILDEIYRVRQEEVEFLQGKSDGQRQVWICRMNLPEAVRTTSNYNEHNGDGIPISNNLSGFVKSGFINNAPQVPFTPVANPPAHSPLNHPYDVQSHLPSKNASPDPNIICAFDTTVPISTSPHGLKRKRESEWIAQVDATWPAIFTQDFSPPVTADVQPYLEGYCSGPGSSLRQGFVSSGPSTTEALEQLDEGRDIRYHLAIQN
ncbi:hypothetical protein N7447_007515 [Penicillium robsamsonii]|uniref:uncharacterized protein n=1 Tax=Penicillium robsamsonii TaxID=1792511 RepID=UPI002546824C|nr:uncharacterized protein N7447_007515 [Penicillium robsamsonii]KAJ5817507.1 hypothetical protein N7447_007515 [Penicillium robsamsonii]